MNYLLVGKIVTTHGLKGEVKLRSNFERKDLSFKENNKLYIGNSKMCLTIDKYRKHQEYDMIVFKELCDISEVISLKQQNVYINKDDLKMSNDEYLYSDLINMDIYDKDSLFGTVTNYENHNGNIVLEIKTKDNRVMNVPISDRYIIKVNKDNKRIYAINLGELIL